MLHVTAMPMPGALRLRALHPLIEGDGSCSLIYDLERAAVVEVPEELQFHVAPALETGDLDEALLGWLVNEDLLTGEGGIGWSDGGAGGPETAGWWHPGRLLPDRRPAPRPHRPGAGGSRPGDRRVRLQAELRQQPRKLHLNWGGAFPGNGLLERIVIESSRLGGLLRQEISFELTLDAREVTPARAGFLAGYWFQVRLLCGSYPAPLAGLLCRPRRQGDAAGGDRWRAKTAVRDLLDHLGDRLTVHCVLGRGRLLDLWEWAKRTGVRHLDATLLDDARWATARRGRSAGGRPGTTCWPFATRWPTSSPPSACPWTTSR